MDADKCRIHLNKSQAVSKPQNKKLSQKIIEGIS